MCLGLKKSQTPIALRNRFHEICGEVADRFFDILRVARKLPEFLGPLNAQIRPAALLRLSAVWAIVVAHFCSNWSLYVPLVWLPSYFKRICGVTLVNAGALSAAPWLVAIVLANVSEALADHLLCAGRSATFVRKLVNTIGLGGRGILLLLLPGAKSPTAGLIIACAANGLGACVIAGLAPHSFDIAPRHAGVIWESATVSRRCPASPAPSSPAGPSTEPAASWRRSPRRPASRCWARRCS